MNFNDLSAKKLQQLEVTRKRLGVSSAEQIATQQLIQQNKQYHQSKQDVQNRLAVLDGTSNLQANNLNVDITPTANILQHGKDVVVKGIDGSNKLVSGAITGADMVATGWGNVLNLGLGIDDYEVNRNTIRNTLGNVIGYRPDEASDIIENDFMSDAYKHEKNKIIENNSNGTFIQNAVGSFVDTLKNPTTAIPMVAETLPQVVGGSAVGKAIAKTGRIANPVTTNAIGHGILATTGHWDSQRKENNLTPNQAMAGLVIGGVTGATTRFLNSGVDIDNIATGLNKAGMKSALVGTPKEMFEEGIQSYTEVKATAVADGKEVEDRQGVDVGMAMATSPYMSALTYPSAVVNDVNQLRNNKVDKAQDTTQLSEITTDAQLKEAIQPLNKGYNPHGAMQYLINNTGNGEIEPSTFDIASKSIIINLNKLATKYHEQINNAPDETTKQQLEQEYQTFYNEKYKPTTKIYDLYVASQNAQQTSEEKDVFIEQLNNQHQQHLQKMQALEQGSVTNPVGLEQTNGTTTSVIKPVLLTQITQPKQDTQLKPTTSKYTGAVAIMGDYSKGDTGIGTGDHFDIRLASDSKVGVKNGVRSNPNAYLSRFVVGGKTLDKYTSNSNYGMRNGKMHWGMDFSMVTSFKGDKNARQMTLSPEWQDKVVNISHHKDSKGGGNFTRVEFTDGVIIHLLHQNKSGAKQVADSFKQFKQGVHTANTNKPTTQKTSQYNPNHGVKTFDDSKANSILRVANNLGINPNDLAHIISFETGGSFDPKARNPKSSATGLIQFMAQTAKGLGTSTQALYNMSFDEQMNYVEKYLRQRGIKAGDGVDKLYDAVTGSQTKEYKRGSKEYELNRVWDADGDGVIRRGEAVTSERFLAHKREYFTGSGVSNQQVNQASNNQSNLQVDDNGTSSDSFNKLYEFINDDSKIDISGLTDEEVQQQTQQREHTKQVAEVLRNYSKFTIEQIDKMSFFSEAQKSMLRNLIETKGFVNNNQTMSEVSKQFFDGKQGGKTVREDTRGIKQYQTAFDRAIRTGDIQTATEYMYDLERFEHSHVNKARLMREVYDGLGSGQIVQIAPDKKGNWQVVHGMSEDELKQAGGVTVSHKSGRLLSQITLESEILTRLKDSYKPVLSGLIDENYTPKQRVYSSVSSSTQSQQQGQQTKQTNKVVTTTDTNTSTVSNQAVLDLERGKDEATGKQLSLSAVKQDKTIIGKQGWLAMPYNLSDNPTHSWQVKDKDEQVTKYVGLIKELSQDDDFVKGLIAEKGKQVKNGGVANKVIKSLLSGLPDDVTKAKRYIANFNHTDSSVNILFSSYDKFDNDLAETNTDKSYVVDADVSDKISHENVILAKTQRKDKHGVDTFSDSNPNSQKLVDAFIKRLAEERDKGQELVFPKNGVSKHLETSAPKTYAYLNQRLKDEFGYDNTQRVFEDKPTDKERSAVAKGSSKNTKTARPAMRSKVKVPKLKPNELRQREKDYLNALNDDAGYFTSGIENLDGINQAVEDYLNGNTEYESNKEFIDSLSLDKTLSNILNHYIQARQYGYEDKSLNDLFNMGSEDLKALAQERFNVVDDKEIKLDEEKEIETEVFGDVTLPTQLINNKVVLDNVLDLLQHIEDNRVSKNEKKYHLELIDGLLNYSPDYQIELIKQDSKEIHDYDEKTKTMKIYLPVNGGNIFELISRGLIQSTNAQVLNDLDSKDARKLNRELDKIRDVINVYIRDNNPEFDANTTYLLSQGLENNTGLIAVGLSSKGVIDFLKQVKTEEKNVKTNLFRRLVRAISDFIGMTNGKETQNLYERLVELSAQASNLQNTTVDKDLYKVSEDGKLTILQNVSNNDVQKELNKDFEYRNHLISAFTQQTGKGKPLASIKDVLGKLRLNLTQGLQALHSTLPTKAQREQVKDFINFQQEFVGHLQDTFRAKQKTDKGDFGYQDLKTFLAVDGEIDENVYTAMSLAVYDYIIENGNHTMNTDKDIKKLLNLEPEDDSYIPKDVREQYRYLGEPSAWSANKMGQSIIKSLGLKHNGLSNPELQSRLEMSVGQWAINAMQSADLVHIHTMKTEDHFNNIINAGGEVPQESNANGVVHFMSVTDAKGLNHNPLLTEIMSKNFGTKGYLAEVFGFESRLTYPKLEKPTEVRLKIKGTDSVVTQEQERLLKRVQAEPVQLAKETVDSIQYLYEHFNDDLLEMFGASVSEEKLKYMHIDDRDGEIAGAEAKLRGLQNALGFISSLDKDEQGNYQEFYLPTYVAKNTRWHFDSNVFNFQTDKIHRAMGEYKSFKSDINTDGVLVSDNHLNYIPEAFFNKDGTTTDLTRFFRALGENLEGTEKFIKAQDVNKLYAQGYTVDKMASIDFIPSLISWFNQDEVKQAVEATKVLLDKPSELKQEHINSIKKFIDMGEMGAGSYRALIEYTRFIQAVEQGKPFTTSLGLGSDGINNGSAISYTLNGALDISPSFAYQVGLIMKTDEQDIDNYFDTRYDHNIGDYYESFAKQIKDYLESSEHPLVKAIQAVHKSASGRKLAKDVLIPFGYSAGIGRISQITLGRFLKDIRDAQVDLAVKYMKLQERKESGTVTDEDYILQMAKLDEDYNALQDNLRVMLGKDYNLPKYEEMLETSLDAEHGRKLTKIYNEHMNKPLGDMLNEYADKFIVTRNKNIAMHETMYGIYQSAYQILYDNLKLKHVNKYKAEIKRKKPDLTDEQLNQEATKKFNNIGLTQQEIEEQVLKAIAKLIPKVDSPFSFIHNETERESRFDAFKWVKELVNKDNIETIGYQYNEQGELQASSTQLPLVQNILESTGVFTNSAQTQGSDAYITTFTSANDNAVVINVHDADIGGIGNYVAMAQKQNEMFFKGMAQYHANLASITGLINSINALDKFLEQSDLSEETKAKMKQDTYFSIYKNLAKGDRVDYVKDLLNYTGEHKDFNAYLKNLFTNPTGSEKVMSSLIQYALTDAKQADLDKLNQLRNLHAVHQYGGEDGQYYLTDADRKLIDEQIDVINKAYDKFSTNQPKTNKGNNTLGKQAQNIIQQFADSKLESNKYSQQLFNRLVSLNPDVRVELVSDLNQIKDKSMRAMVEVGGAFVPEQNTLYIYPDNTDWEQSTLELINHELTHSVTAQAIKDKAVDLSLLDEIKDKINNARISMYETLSETVLDRLGYMLSNENYHHEIIAIASSEYEVRQALKSILGVDTLNQLNKLTSDLIKVNFNEQKQSTGIGGRESVQSPVLPSTNTNSTGTVQGLSTTVTASTNAQGTKQTNQTSLSISSTKQTKVKGLHEQLQEIINSKVNQEVKDKASELLQYSDDYDIERKALGIDKSDYVLSKDKIIINTSGLSGDKGALLFLERLEKALNELGVEKLDNAIQDVATVQVDLRTQINNLVNDNVVEKHQKTILNYLLERVTELNPNISFGFDNTIIGHGYFDHTLNKLGINPEIWAKHNAVEKAGLAIHELYHAITDTTLYKYRENPNSVNKTQAKAIQLLEQMRQAVETGLLKDKAMTDKLSYSVSNLNEFIAHGMSDPDVKTVIAKYTQGIKDTKSTTLKDRLLSFFNAVADLLGFSKAENKAYKDFVQAVSQVESKYVPIQTTLKSESKYSIATDKVNSLSAVEVLKSLNADGLDETHNNHLDNMIDLIGAYYDKNETNKKKVDKSLKKLESKPLNHGFALTDKEAYVYAILEEIGYEYLQAQAGNLATSELNTLYNEVSKQITSVDKLFDGFNALSKEEQTLLRKKYNFVFGAKNANKPHRFMALTLVSQEFRALMNRARQREQKSADTWFAKLMNYVISALNFFKDKRLGKTNTEVVDNLMYKLSQIDTQGRNRLDDIVAYAWNLAIKPLNATNNLASKGLVKAIDLVKVERLVHWRDVTKTTVIAGGNFTTQALLNNFSRKASDNNQPLSFMGELLNEMSATTAVKSFVERMIRHTQKLAQERSTIKSATERTLNSLFKTKLSNEQRNSITAMVLRTDANSLFNQFNKATVKKLLTDSSLRQQEINKLYEQLERNPNANDMIMQAKSLAYYMVTERATEHLVKSVQAIAMGVGTDYQIEYDAIDTDLVNQLDVLVSLLALEYTPKEHQQQFTTVIGNDEQAIFEVMALHKSMVDTAKQEFVSNPLNFAKGYLPQLTNRYKSIMFANPEQVADLEKDGWVRINDDVLHQDLSDSTDSRVLMFHDDMSYRSYVSGALDMIDTASKGTEVYNADNHTDMQRVTNEKVARRNQRNQHHHSEYDPFEQETAMIASYDSQGYLMNYHYEMSGFLRDNYLERNNDFAEMLGTYRSQQLYKKDIEPHQRALAQGIHEDYIRNYTKQAKEFIVISPESTNPEIQRIWRMLPHEFRKEAKALFGDNTFVIRNTVFNATFGFKAYSLADMFDKIYEDKGVLEKILTGILTAIAGDKAKSVTLKAERLIEYLTGQAKDFIVIRSGQVLLGNIISNLLLLGLSGINPLQLVKEFAFAWKNGKAYSQIEKRLAEIAVEIKAKGNQSELLKERNRLQQQLDSNPLKPFMKAGLMSTIVEDVEQDTDIEQYGKSLYEEKIDKVVSRVPKPIKTIFDYATLNTNTEPYKFLSEATQFSDFGAKIVLARHLMRQGKSLNEAISQAQDHFINYDIPTSRGLDYMNRVGLMMFTKFFLRFQKIMFNLLHKKLATSVAQHNLVEFMTPFQGIYEPLMFNRIGNPFEMPVYTYFTSIDDALTLQLIT